MGEAWLETASGDAVEDAEPYPMKGPLRDVVRDAVEDGV